MPCFFNIQILCTASRYWLADLIVTLKNVTAIFNRNAIPSSQLHILIPSLVRVYQNPTFSILENRHCSKVSGNEVLI